MRAARWSTIALAVVLVAGVLAGCGRSGIEQDGARSTATPSDSAAQSSDPGAAPTAATTLTTDPDAPTDPTLPTLVGPSGAPRTPSDLVPTDILVGTIMADSDGSCYTLQTDDGDTYALVGGDGRPLARGTVVRVKITQDPPPAPLSCLGQPVTIATLEIV